MFDGHDKRAGLSAYDLDLLMNKVLPTARRWVREYPAGSTLHEEGKRTLAYWGGSAE